LKQITDASAIEPVIDDIIANNSGQVEQYRRGKDKLFGFLSARSWKLPRARPIHSRLTNYSNKNSAV